MLMKMKQLIPTKDIILPMVASNFRLTFYTFDAEEIYTPQICHSSKVSIYFDKEFIKLAWLAKGISFDIQALRLAKILKIEYLDGNNNTYEEFKFEILDVAGSTELDTESEEPLSYLFQFNLQ
jgi:hypothetical protein